MRFYSDLFHGIGDSIRFLGIDYTPTLGYGVWGMGGLGYGRLGYGIWEVVVWGSGA